VMNLQRFIVPLFSNVLSKRYCTSTAQAVQTPKKPSDSLARDLLALERTYLAWVRTSILCFSLGVAMSEYRRFLPEGDPKKQNADSLLYKMEKFGGFGVIVAGQLVLIKSTIRYFTTSRKLMKGDLFTTNKLGVTLLSSLVAVASCIACLGTLPFAQERLERSKGTEPLRTS
jgi:putative membrane protein